VTERNRSDSRYVEIFTHYVGKIGAPSRRTVFGRGENTKHYEVPNIARRNTKACICQEERVGFKATADLNKRKVHQGDVSVYIKNVRVDSISLRQKCNYKKRDGKNARNNGRKYLLDVLKLDWHW
jgi:hypothetical protein